jgi:indolepyruvate ferredoxin oxidoreductase
MPKLFKLMAYKDEYEVARLYSDGSFASAIAKQFTGDFSLKFHLSPPLGARIDPLSGRPFKKIYGPWMMQAFAVLAKMKLLRGTPFDIFGRTAERRMERQLIADYRRTVESLLSRMQPANAATAIEIASVPEMIRGFGLVKAANVEKAQQREAELLVAFAGKAPPLNAAAE